MSELPSNPDPIAEVEPKTFEFGGAKSSEDFQLKTPPEISTDLSGQVSRNGLLFNVIIPLSLIGLGAAVLFLRGAAEAEQQPNADSSRKGILKTLKIAEIKPIHPIEHYLTKEDGKPNGRKLQLRVDGTVVPYREAQIASEVAGRIVEKSPHCEAGSFVKEGDVLMKIDDTDYLLDVERLTKEKKQAYVSLQEVDQEMLNANELIKVAKVDLDLATKDLKRQEDLNARGFGSEAEFVSASRSVNAAEQKWVTSKNTLSLLEKRRTRLEASEALAGTQLKLANENLKRCKIVAPMSGVIVNENAELNSFVARGNSLVTIEDTSKVEVSANLRMDQLYWVLDQVGESGDAIGNDQTIGYELPKTDAVIEYQIAGREEAAFRWKGKLLRYDGIGVDPVTRTVPVRVVVDEPSKYLDEKGPELSSGPTALVRGMYVRVLLLIEPKTPLYVVPAEAIRPGNRLWQFKEDASVIDEIQKELSLQANLAPMKGVESEAEAPEKELVAEGQRLCPMCQAKMSTEERNGINIDHCEEHGYWIDDIDLKRPDDDISEEDWIPGRIVVRGSVTPVDSLTVATPTDPFGDQEKLWVCEIGGPIETDNLWVVVSQLGSVEEVGIPVRVAKETAGQSKVPSGEISGIAPTAASQTSNESAKEAPAKEASAQSSADSLAQAGEPIE